MGFMVVKVALGQIFLKVLQFYQYHSTSAPYSMILPYVTNTI
jgi:hypothetical protein